VFHEDFGHEFLRMAICIEQQMGAKSTNCFLFPLLLSASDLQVSVDVVDVENWSSQ
jgi:hypothetical protein